MNKKVKTFHTSSNREIEKLVRNDISTFIKMIETNDVHEADLSNKDN